VLATCDRYIHAWYGKDVAARPDLAVLLLIAVLSQRNRSLIDTFYTGSDVDPIAWNLTQATVEGECGVSNGQGPASLRKVSLKMGGSMELGYTIACATPAAVLGQSRRQSTVQLNSSPNLSARDANCDPAVKYSPDIGAYDQD
jgi:hypothetical protein